MIQQNSESFDDANSLNGGTEEHLTHRPDASKKTKSIQKGKKKTNSPPSQSDQSEHNHQLTREQKKEIQKEKNRIAAQLSRDRQKKFVDDLELKIKLLENQLQNQICRKCKNKLQQFSTSEEENSFGYFPQQQPRELDQNQFDLLNEEPEVQALPFIRVPFEKSDLGFGKIGSFFCLSMLVLAVICIAGSMEDQKLSVSHESRLMQAISADSDYCRLQKPEERTSEINVPSTLEYSSNWPFISAKSDGSLNTSDRCKSEFWKNYLDSAQAEVSDIDHKNLLNCNSPTLVRISNPHRPDGSMNDKWTFLISDPTITHAHFEENGQFFVDQADYLSGVYQMVAEKVVLKKVIGKNCLA